ncbi:MAG: hypothetical protein AB8G22_29355, partial [Saprospiraceae bacterium]
LLQDDNPFALAVLACRQIYQTRKQFEQRMILKSQLFQLIWKRHFVAQKFSKDVVTAIAGFVNNLMKLPQPLEQQYQSQSVNIIMDDIRDIEKRKQEPHYQFVNKLFKAMHGESMEEFIERHTVDDEEILRRDEEILRRNEEIARKDKEIELLLERSKQKMKAAEAKQKQEKEKRKKEEAKRKEEEAKRKEQEAILRQQQIDMILLLHRLNQTAEQISTELKFNLDFVKQVIAGKES